MKRCFGYVRVSTVKQGDGVSLAAQKEAIEAFASRHSIEIVQWFEEKETAAKRGRPLFNQMVKELRRGKAHGLVIHKIDRSARNFADWAKIGDLQDAGIDIHFATESLDFRSRGGRLTADIQAVIAADYIRNLREETVKGITGRLKQGLYPFRAPIGYLDNGGGKPKTLDPIRAPLVKLAFELYASRRHSLRSLLRELAHKGLTNRRGGPLTMCGLETMLNNPFYTGVIHIKRTGMTYRGLHERLISPNLFERVQAIKSGKSGPKITRHDHTYRGLFRCGHCDGPMVPELQKGHVYYRCTKKGCPTKTMREEVISAAIEACLLKTQLSVPDMTDFEARLLAWTAADEGQEQEKAWQLRRSNLQDRIDRLTDALIDRLIERNAFADRRQRLALEEEALEQEREEWGKKAEKAAHMRSLIELANSLVSSHQLADSAEKRQLVEMTTSNRRVFGKEVYLEPSDWLDEVENMPGVLSGAPARDRHRRGANKKRENE
ncbi:recombinase family protein [Erythrobacter sp.]|uniref:recombinase family protein n=1 Tax=Erythrobacter sp. TaxID=1042 RepID=UPI001B101AEA|nr:recombinase family protein [Erythrobacter sp.]MBO6527596.1 recombinase family protein [Erythrobacter sp.]MBO6530276.1 recombinase family protein [Erythrobacter sp.]